MPRWGFGLVPVLASAVACGGCSERGAAAPSGEWIVPREPVLQVVRSKEGVVVTQQPLATDVGVRILEQGGNAVDATVAAAFALAVVEPTDSGIGGRAQILIRHPDGTVAALDGTTEVPRGFPEDAGGRDLNSGYGMIGTPGAVAVLAAALERHGTLPLRAVMAPAIELAERGFPLSASEAEGMARVADDLSLYEGSRRSFLRPDGMPYAAGERFVQPDLAATLRTIAEQGPDAFYHGEIAQRIAADMADNGGWLTLADLEAYRVHDALVSRTPYRGHTVIGTYLPAAGSNLQAMLGMLERVTPTPETEDFPWSAVVAQVMLLGFYDRLLDLANAGPPETFPLPERMEWLLAPERLQSRADKITRKGPIKFARPIRSRSPGSHEEGNTTHVSVVDAQGRAVSLTQSVGPTMGSRVATPGLGFAYAATMGYLSGTGQMSGIRALAAGQRASSRQCPTIVLDPEGNLEMVLGAAGSRKIVSSLLQVVSRTIDRGMSLEEAVAAPRLHIEPGEGRFGILHVEETPGRTWPDIVLARLGHFGFVLLRGEDLGTVSAIQVDADGTATGVADPRMAGSAGSPRTHASRTQERSGGSS